MSQIPLLAWVAIILIALMTIAIYLVLFALLSRREQMKDLNRKMRSRPPNPTIWTIQNIKEVARDPFRQEREQINELSKLVSDLKEPPSGGSESGSQNPPQKPEPPNQR